MNGPRCDSRRAVVTCQRGMDVDMAAAVESSEHESWVWNSGGLYAGRTDALWAWLYVT